MIPRPKRDELALSLRHLDSRGIAKHYGVGATTAYNWILYYGLRAQPIPLEDKLLMAELYYTYHLPPRIILKKFEEEIPILTLRTVEGILRPFECPLDVEKVKAHHIRVAKEKES